jgi:hypothetical protein
VTGVQTCALPISAPPVGADAAVQAAWQAEVARVQAANATAQAAYEKERAEWSAGQAAAGTVSGINPLGAAAVTLLSIIAALWQRRQAITANGAAVGMVTAYQTVKQAAPPEQQRQMVETLLGLLPKESKAGALVARAYRALVPVPTTPGKLPGEAAPAVNPLGLPDDA